ncbi:MAG TPA: DNA polymerase III subunit delta' [Methylophilaceae bacterium]|nr:DNA polymerase III subunit delta' [Methylophilaceae bacterium]
MHPWQENLWGRIAAGSARLPHAMLLRGQEGIGKYDFAVELAQALLCHSPLHDGRACGQCASCGWFAQSHHPDYRLLSPELESEGEGAPATVGRKSQISVAQIRALSDFFELSSHQSGGRRVVLIHPAEALNPASANALLKILEEPPAGVVFLLVAHQPQRLLPTILSRCHKIDMPIPSSEAALAWLKGEGIQNAEKYLAYAGGSPLLAKLMAEESSKQMDELWKALSLGARLDPFTTAALFAKLGMTIAVQVLQKWVYDLAGSRLTGEVRYHTQQGNALQALANSVDLGLLFELQRKLDEARRASTHPLNSELQLENLLLQYTQIFPTSGRLR